MNRLLIIISLSVFCVCSASAVTKADADSAYNAGKYQEAIKGYEMLLKQGVSEDLYYNLGNAYYRTEDITHAVLNYERALRLSPGDKDIRHNLQIARSKTVDRITPETEFFFITWLRAIENSMSVDTWASAALISLAIAIIMALIYLFSNAVWLRKVGFFSAAFMLLVFVLCNIFAYAQKQSFTKQRGAIIMDAAVNVKSTPVDNGTDLFILHEGTRVDIIDDQMKQWKQIRVADGKEGWVMSKQIEVI